MISRRSGAGGRSAGERRAHHCRFRSGSEASDESASTVGSSLALTQTVDAPAAEVFRCWADRRLLSSWFSPPGYSAVVAHLDARPGGGYAVIMSHPEDGLIQFVGTFTELREPDRLSYTCRCIDGPLGDEETRVTIELHEQGQSTEVSVLHGGLADDQYRDFFSWAWPKWMSRLAWLTRRAEARAEAAG
jgi:uncharacterized protein YndB with AHSA1/START domain